MQRLRKLGAALELLGASGLWGFGFVATAWALEAVNAFELTLLRFLIAGLVGFAFLWRASVRRDRASLFRLSFVPALWMTGTLVFQTWGMQYTTATKSGFITTLYVVFVPLLEARLTRKPIPLTIWLCVVTALVGTGLIVDLGLSDINRGDLLTLICAVLATGQIYWMSGVSPRVREPFAFNIFQCYWSLPLCFMLVRPGELLNKLSRVGEWPTHAVIGVMCLALGSTVIAFYLQVRAQAKLSPTVSSLVFLLESPFAMLFSLWFLGQSLGRLESLGAILIFASALLATWVEARARTKKD